MVTRRDRHDPDARLRRVAPGPPPLVSTPMPSTEPQHRTGPQLIPRPPSHRPGGPAPWSHLPEAVRASMPLAAVVEAVANRDRTLDAEVTATELSAFSRTFTDAYPDANPAAVLVALFEEVGESRVLLTVRSSRLRSHQGEVAFPGGKLDPDEGIEEGARREAEEEVGLDPATVTVVGHLTAMPTVSSNTLMTPVVATLSGRPVTVPAPDEVARVFDVALADLLADGVWAEELWAVPGRSGRDGQLGSEFPVWFFSVAGETVWGATARVLTELLCLVLGVPGPASGRRR
jgi:8-oxo-dGTP pyrophosphatase MutT (NUDIX family)